MRWSAFLLIITAAAMPFAARGQSGAAPALVAALRGVRSVDAASIIAWGADPKPPENALARVGAVEAQILALDTLDREALLFWLRSHGRDALHQRHATDGQIGPPLYPVDYAIRWTMLPAGFTNPTPLPAARAPAPPESGEPSMPRGVFDFVSSLPLPNVSIPIASSSSSSSRTYMQGNTQVTESSSSGTSVSAQVNVAGLVGMLAQAAAESQPPPEPTAPPAPDKRWTLLQFGRPPAEPGSSGIAVSHGVAGIRNNSEAAACIAFANHNAKPVHEVDFDMTFVDAHDLFLQTMALRRVGVVAQNENVDAPRDLAPAKVLREDGNCVMIGHIKYDAPPIPSLARAVALSYGVRRVVFADGTLWQRPGTNAWPSSSLPGVQP
jgi:hypothetical protein